MSKFLKGAILALGLLGTVSAAEAMPAVPNLAAPATVAGVPQIEKTVIIVRRRVVRPRVFVRRPRVIIRRRPIIRRPLIPGRIIIR